MFYLEPEAPTHLQRNLHSDTTACTQKSHFQLPNVTMKKARREKKLKTFVSVSI